MLWLALHLRQLSLEIFTRGNPSSRPLAIASGTDGNQAVVVAANSPAYAHGVHSGMAVSAACALASDLLVLEQNSAKERVVLQHIAAWAMQFTPIVHIAGSVDVLLEIGGSLKLLGGPGNIKKQILHKLDHLGFTARIACAPTPLAAQWLAQANSGLCIQNTGALSRALEKLPVSLLTKNVSADSMLRSFGVRTIGECLQLPRAGLARRFGQPLLDDLDRALGKISDPRTPFEPPQKFSEAVPLPAPVEHAEALLFAARRLLAGLCGFLAATGKGVQRIDLEFAHKKLAATRISMQLVAASRDPDHLTSVLRERLARLDLPAPATEILMSAKNFSPLASENFSFLPSTHGETAAMAKLVERLHARLGDQSVSGLTLATDYRPEHAWRTCPPSDKHKYLFLNDNFYRPLWLLETPEPLGEGEPCYDGRLDLLAGPECIETGWWDSNAVKRDYFIARNPQHALLWIFKERFSRNANWHLHGFFA